MNYSPLKIPYKICLSLTLMIAATAQADDTSRAENNFLKISHLAVHAGFISAHQGESQHVAIQDLIGDDYSVSNGVDINALLGLGYFLDGYSFSRVNLEYGINAYYMFPTMVKGYITQESAFTNLSYQYKITNIPIYGMVRALFNNKNDLYQIFVDAGIGPNVISTSDYEESALNSFTIPNNTFKSATEVAFSANAGFGIRLNQFLPKPVECGYRFFYLGSGELHSANSQVSSNLDTGNSYAHSLVCSLIL